MIERTDNFMAELGVEAYRVGGSVRDEILGRRVKDADYIARGVGLVELGERLRDHRADWDKFDVRLLKLRDGRQAGWRVSARSLGCIEIVLPRKEISTGPGHRDFEIVVDPKLTLAEDAERRDFTFNALYKIINHPDNLHTTVAGANGVIYEDIIDPLGGVEDLQRRLIRTTHHDSFRDDPLRALRALRFVSTLGYDLARDTYAEMVAHADAVTGLSAKGYASGTVLDELSKILMGDSVAEALRIARDTGVLRTLLPELAPMLGFEQGSRYHDLTTDEHTFSALETAAHVGASLRVRMALLFHDSGKPQAAWAGPDGRKHYYAKLLPGGHPDGDPTDPVQTEDHEVAGERIWRAAALRLNAPVRLREDVATLIRHHMVPLQGRFKASKVRQMRVQFGDDLLRDLLLHRACDVSGKGRPNRQHLERLNVMEVARASAQRDEVPSTPADLEVTGKDALALGLSDREIGFALRDILHLVASEPTEMSLSREWQLRRLESAAGRWPSRAGGTWLSGRRSNRSPAA